MAPGHILQIFLWVTVQNQIRIAQRVIVDEIVQFRPLFSFPKKTKNPNPSPIEKRFGFSILTAVLPVDIPTGPGTAHEQKPHWADCLRHCAAGPCGLRLLTNFNGIFILLQFSLRLFYLFHANLYAHG